jgi:hypothetical protein
VCCSYNHSQIISAPEILTAFSDILFMSNWCVLVLEAKNVFSGAALSNHVMLCALTHWYASCLARYSFQLVLTHSIKKLPVTESKFSSLQSQKLTAKIYLEVVWKIHSFLTYFLLLHIHLGILNTVVSFPETSPSKSCFTHLNYISPLYLHCLTVLIVLGDEYVRKHIIT